jgi:conjugal transfer/entry exclusion protein
MRRLIVVVALVLLLGWEGRVFAQGVPVYDNANFLQNLITAVQAVLTTIEAFLIEANQVLELTSLDEIGVSGGIAEDMALLGRLVEQAEGLSYDIASLQAQINALFHLESAPATRDGLAARIAEIKRIKYEAYGYAARVHTLLRTAARTVEHLKGLLDTVSALVGNKQGHQTSVQAQVVIAKHIANLDVQTTAFNRAQVIDKLAEALITESIAKIQASRMEDWPGF